MEDYIYRVGMTDGAPLYVTATSIAEAFNYLTSDCGWDSECIREIECISEVLIGQRG